MPNLALENIRSLYNVGSILRTCSFFGIKKVFLIGYSGKMQLPNGGYELSTRLAKTALGSQNDIELVCVDSTHEFIEYCQINVLTIYAVEQHKSSKNLFEFVLDEKVNSVFVLGNEIDGVSEAVLTSAKEILEIPRFGVHNSLNVSTAAAVLLTALLKN